MYMQIVTTGTGVMTEGLREYRHAEIHIDAGDPTLVVHAAELLEQLAALVVDGTQRFQAGERLNLQTLLTEFREVDGVLELWEPAGATWRPGIKRGLQTLQTARQFYEEQAHEEELVDINTVCSISAAATTAETVIMRRRGRFSNHSGWEIIAEADLGNPAAISHPSLVYLWQHAPHLVQYLFLPVGSEITVTNDVPAVAYATVSSDRPWEEADNVWAHHDPVDVRHADWVVSARLHERSGSEAPAWEWIPAQRIGLHRARICAVPFLVHGLACGDEVLVNDHGVIVDRVAKSGRVAVRIEFFEREGSPLMSWLEQQGFRNEWMSRNLLAVDCADDRAAYRLLEQVAASEECVVISHSLPRLPRRMDSEGRQRAGLRSVQHGGLLALAAALFVDTNLLDRIVVAFSLIIAVSAILFALTLYTWNVFPRDIRSPGSWRRRVAAARWACGAVITVLLGMQIAALALWQLGLLALGVGLLVVKTAARHNVLPLLPTTPRADDVPPPFYRYARITHDAVTTEILVAHNGSAQALSSGADTIESRSYDSLQAAQIALGIEDLSGWWYRRA
jgi:hypothetical protein